MIADSRINLPVDLKIRIIKANSGFRFRMVDGITFVQNGGMLGKY